MIIFDTETTELMKPDVADISTQPHIIEFAMIKLDDASYKELGRYETLLNPGVPINDEEHKKITGLTNADLVSSPTFLEAYGHIVRFVLGQRVLVAHNLEFDRSALTAELRRIGKEYAFPYPPAQICTVVITKHLKGRRLKLTELYQLKLGKELKQKHRAMSDAEALAEIVRKMKI